MSKKFPCPYCKGQGTWIEVVLEETGQGPTYSCGCCEGKGMVEIDGPIHKRMKKLRALQSAEQ